MGGRTLELHLLSVWDEHAQHSFVEEMIGPRVTAKEGLAAPARPAVPPPQPSTGRGKGEITEHGSICPDACF